jgi:GR25 family glycosyltransferase involved in LPS biosynthesis
VNLPKIYCISMERSVDRRRKVEFQFARFDLPVEFFDGFDGFAAGIASTIKPDLTPGHCGLIMSYLFVWEIAARRDDPEILVFEDDIILCDDFPRQFWKSYQALPSDWQLVYLGHFPNHKRQKINDRVWFMENPYLTHANLYRKEILPKLIKENRILKHHIDIQLHTTSLPSLKYYAFIPELVKQTSATKQIKSTCGPLNMETGDR